MRGITEVAMKMKKWQGRLWRTALCYVFRLCKLNSNKIVFSNFGGNGYGDNPKYIAEEIIRQHLDYDLVWILREDILGRHTLPSHIRAVKGNSLRELYELMTAMFWVDNLLKASYIKKRKNQYYIQTHHGMPALKKFEDDSYVKDHERIDLCLSNCSWFSSLARRRFGYRGEILECGAPRNDIFFERNQAVQDKVRKHFGIIPSSKIVLYVPTWRKDLKASTHELDIGLCLNSLLERFSTTWTFMLRLHPNVADEQPPSCRDAHVVNATAYEDVQELLAAADAVITDYSAIMFDFAIKRQPVFLYAPDAEDYQRVTGFHFNLEDLPFQVSHNNMELARHIREFDSDNYVARVDGFFDNIGSYESGRASQTVTGRIRSYSIAGKTSRLGWVRLSRR